VNQKQSSAKRAGRAVLELATLLSDGSWYTTSYLGVAAGKYLRPEIAWRTGQGNTKQGQRQYINTKLDVWLRCGRVEKRRNGNFTEWRLAKSEWVVPYLRALIEILREQAKSHYEQPVGRGRSLLERIEREQEILRLHREGFSQRQIGERLKCDHTSVFRVLKASKAQIDAGAIAPLPLYQRMAIADAPPEKEQEIAKVVVAKRLTLKETKKLVRQAIEGNEHD
jgi:hypothetical protein